jgi:hypothetical protein
MKLPLVLLSCSVLLALTGCVTGQRTLAIAIPTEAPKAATKAPIYIASVTDDRVFENKPSSPSTPSIDGDVTTMPASQKDRMIGRQRNSFGKAMGDIALANGDTVTKQVRALVEEGLRRKGYEISGDPATPTSLAIGIDEFWAWMTPGFVALTFEARISTHLTLKDTGGNTKMEVKGSGLNHGQVAKDGNWLEAFTPAFEQYLINLSEALDKARPN